MNKNQIPPDIDPDSGVTKMALSHQIKNFGRLGKEIKITPKTHISINKENFKIEWFEETISIIIGIGNDHCAHLVMSANAWEALKSGEKVSVTTTEEFKKMYG